MSQGVDNNGKALLHFKVVENWFKPIQMSIPFLQCVNNQFIFFFSYFGLPVILLLMLWMSIIVKGINYSFQIGSFETVTLNL